MKKIALLGMLSLLGSAANAQTATISTTDATTSGLNLSTNAQSAPATTVYFSNDGNTLLYVRNNSGASVNLTQISQQAAVNVQGYGPVTLASKEVAIPSASHVVLGPFPKGRWNNTVYDTMAVSLSTATGVSMSAVRVPQQ